MLDRLHQTIVAISSAPGHAPVGILRLSGPDACALAEGLLRPEDRERIGGMAGSTRAETDVVLEDGLSVPARLYLFRAPRSYTREDLVELHTVGSPVVLEMLHQSAVRRGAAPALPGEFTARAFLNGRMDLAEAEAVAGVIRAQSDTQLRAARRMSGGALAKTIAALRDDLGQLLALVEADIDFAEEPVEFISAPLLKERLAALGDQLRNLLAGARAAETLDRLPHVLLLGPPNAGKSSLMNRLSGMPRAICAAVAGTTRDILAAPIRIGRGEAILLDSAGVDDSPDEILAQARELTLATAEQVDLVCFVVDAAAAPVSIGATLSPWASPARGLPKSVVAANKCDLLSGDRRTCALASLSSLHLGPVVAASAVEDGGIDDLRAALADALASTDTTTLGEAVLISERQRIAITEAADALHRATELAQDARETIDCAELVAFELREALDALGAVTGAVTTDDLLAHVFANFCIGK